jgi:Zn-dependent M28 family amino/carboxypeptidase
MRHPIRCFPMPAASRRYLATACAYAVAALALWPAVAPAQGGGAKPSPAAKVAEALDANVYQSHLEFLADDALEGRAPGTRGGDLAAQYIAAQFRRLGLEPAGDSGTYFHRVPIISLTPSPALRVTGTSPVELKYRDDYVLWAMRNDSLVELAGDLVFVGHGIVAPEYGWNDYEGVDAKGKVVVALVNDPGLRDSTIFRGKVLTYYGRWTYKIEEAQRQGAAGLLLIHTDESATYPWTTVKSSWTGEQVRLETPARSLAAAGWLHWDAAARVFQAGGADLRALVDQAYRKGFRATPLRLRAEGSIRSEIRRSVTQNVLGRWAGRGAAAREVVMIGGHYDHLGIGDPVDGDSIYNGAQDNASGTAGVLAAAEAFVRSGIRTGRSMLFVAFAAEESGLLGAEALVARPPVPLRDVAAILNIDGMNLYGRTRDASALGLDQSSLGAVFTAAARAEGLRVTSNFDALLRGAFFRSDHFPLARAGIPGTSIENGSDYVGQGVDYGKRKEDEYVAKRYHQPSDELLPWFSTDGAMQQLRVTVRTAVAVGNAMAQPTWNATSEFREAGQKRRAGGS